MRSPIFFLCCLLFTVESTVAATLLDSILLLSNGAPVEERIAYKHKAEHFFSRLSSSEDRQQFAQAYLDKSRVINDSILSGHARYLIARSYDDTGNSIKQQAAWRTYQNLQSHYGWHLNDLPNGEKYWYHELQIFQDRTGQQTIDDVRSHPQWFQLNDTKDQYLPNEVYWAKLILHGHPKHDNYYLFHLAADHSGRLSWLKIDAWLEHADGQMNQARTGFLVAKPEKAIPTAENMIRFPIAAHEKVVLYVRMEGTKRFVKPGLIRFGIVTENWWAEKNSAAWRSGSLLAVLVIQVLYFMILFFIEREQIHLFFSIAMLGLALDYGSRFVNEFSTTYGTLELIAYSGIPVFLIGITRYTAYYFNLPEQSWISKKGIPAFSAIALFYILLAWTTYGSFEIEEIPTVLVGLLVSFLIIIAIAGIGICLFLLLTAGKTYPQYQKFYLLSFSPLLVLLLLFTGLAIISSQGLALTSEHYFDFVTYAQEISLFLMLVLLALSTGYRAKRQREEKQRAVQQEILHQQKANLYTNITHEFRTPLTVIVGMAEEIEKKPKQATEMIRRNANNLLQLINQILDLSKLESGNLKLHEKQQDVVRFLLYLSESFQSLADTKGVRLTTYNEVDELWMDIDPEKLQQIVANLLSNAIKFTPEHGRVILHITQVIDDDNKPQLQIKVKDNGIGIPKEQLEFIFDRFFQVEGETPIQNTGTGIGLALCKELVELMGGNISADSGRGKGTEFKVLLPIKNEALTEETLPASEAVPHPKSTPTTDISTAVSDKPLLLIIEDNQDVVSYIKTCVEAQYTLLIAPNGQIGIDTALQDIPDIIISDVMMPEKSGYEVCAALKSDQRTSHIPIVLLTAKYAEDDKIKGLSHGADAYLTKPFNKEELLVRLEKLVAVRQLLRDRYQEVTLDKIKDKTSNDPNDAFLLQLHQLVEDNLSDSDFGIPQICRGMGMSRSQIYRKLTALTGKSTSLYIRSIRLQKAKILLQTTEMNVAEVAYDVGFTDPLYFSRVFSQEFGIPPSQA